MGTSGKEHDFATAMSVRDLGGAANAFFAGEKAEVSPIQMGNNPLDALEQQADIAVVGRRRALTSMWAVHLYVFDEGDKRRVKVIALGDGAGAKFMNGSRNSLSMAKSTEAARKLLEKLRSSDPSIPGFPF